MGTGLQVELSCLRVALAVPYPGMLFLQLSWVFDVQLEWYLFADSHDSLFGASGSCYFLSKDLINVSSDRASQLVTNPHACFMRTIAKLSSTNDPVTLATFLFQALSILPNI